MLNLDRWDPYSMWSNSAKNAKIWFRIALEDKRRLAERCRLVAQREILPVSARGGEKGQKSPGYLLVFMWLLDDYWDRKGL